MSPPYLKYPEEAREQGVEGTVFVDFVIDKSGNVTRVVASDVVGEDVDIFSKRGIGKGSGIYDRMEARSSAGKSR